MPHPLIVTVAPASPAELAGLAPGDEIVAIGGVQPRDVIEWHQLTDEPELRLDIERSGSAVTVEITKGPGEPLGAQVQSALFDQVRTCDNHCEFCFIYQLPPGLRESLYLKDDDYRLSFLYGNYTTLTRFTEADLERVVTERLSPLNVSIHATDPEIRADMLRNRRGATSLRWLSLLLEHGIGVHGQVVVCPGVNDGAVLADTLAGVLDRYTDLATLCVVPLGVSRFNTEARLRPHTAAEVERVLELVHEYQEVFRRVIGRRLVFAADEYYLLAGRDFPAAEAYEDFAMHEDGIGMARTFEREFTGQVDAPTGVQPGFFAWVDAAPAGAYRRPRAEQPVTITRHSEQPARTAVLTSTYGAAVLEPLLGERHREVQVVPVENRYFGGNIGVAGLLVGEDLSRVLAEQPAEPTRYLLPDVCLSDGRFLDGSTPADLPRPVEVVPTDGISLGRALDAR